MENIKVIKQKLIESHAKLANLVKLKQSLLDQFNICMDNIWDKGNTVNELEQCGLAKQQHASSNKKAYSFFSDRTTFKTNLEQNYIERQQRIKSLNLNETIEEADKAIALLKARIKSFSEQIDNLNKQEYIQQSEQSNNTASVLAF